MNRNYRDDKMLEKRKHNKEAFLLWKKIHTDRELQKFERRGFLKGAMEGKTMDVTFHTVVESLKKQIQDWEKARLSSNPELMKKCLADLRSVAGCVFLKLKEKDNRCKLLKEKVL